MIATFVFAASAAANTPLTDRLIENAIERGRFLQASTMIAERKRGSGYDNADTARLEGALALAQGRYGDAYAAFGRAIARDGRNCASLEGQGRAAIGLGRWRAARSALDETIALCPDHWRAFNARGVAADGLQDWAASAESYARATALAPGEPSIANNRGYSLILQKRYAEALAVLEPAAAAHPDNERLARNIALARASLIPHEPPQNSGAHP